MRKRLLTGVVAAVVIGAVAYVLSQPKEGSVEWHKREYLRAQSELAGRTLQKQVKRLIYSFRARIGFRPKRTLDIPAGPRDGELQKHQRALIQLGFLEEKTISVSRPLYGRVDGVVHETRTMIPEKRRQFAQLSTPSIFSVPSSVTIVAPREDIAVWENLIRKADVKIFPEPIPTTNRSLMLPGPDTLPMAAGLDDMLQEKHDVRRGGR